MEGQLKASQPKEDEGKDAGENEQAAGESEGRGSNGSVAGKEGGSKREDGKKDGGKESVWDKTWATTAGLQHVEGVSALMQGLDGPGSHPILSHLGDGTWSTWGTERGNSRLQRLKEEVERLEWSLAWEHHRDGGAGGEWAAVSEVAAAWMEERKGWLQRVREAGSVSRVARALLVLEHALHRLAPCRQQLDDEGRRDKVTGRAFAQLVMQGRIDSRWWGQQDEEEAGQLWEKEAEGERWRSMVAGATTIGRAALGLYVLGDRAGAALRSLFERRLRSHKFLKLRISVWTEDVGAYEWHACTITNVRVPAAWLDKGVHRVRHLVRWQDDDDDEWLYLPEESFQVWRPKTSKSAGQWAEPLETGLAFLLLADPAALKEAAAKRRKTKQ